MDAYRSLSHADQADLLGAEDLELLAPGPAVVRQVVAPASLHGEVDEGAEGVRCGG
jgi:hypothetical protein